jgi:hypothetical protein
LEKSLVSDEKVQPEGSKSENALDKALPHFSICISGIQQYLIKDVAILESVKVAYGY